MVKSYLQNLLIWQDMFRLRKVYVILGLQSLGLKFELKDIRLNINFYIK